MLPSILPKKCTRCGSEGPFPRDSTKKDGLSAWCRACHKATASIKVQRRANLKHHYKITPEIYTTLLRMQKNRCAICGRDQEEVGKRFGVDHDHKTGNIRGLLCTKCNSGLGNFNDDVSVILLAAYYLKGCKNE